MVKSYSFVSNRNKWLHLRVKCFADVKPANAAAAQAHCQGWKQSILPVLHKPWHSSTSQGHSVKILVQVEVLHYGEKFYNEIAVG